jgi:glycosyltransferase involved in cell wall biosynthesis
MARSHEVLAVYAGAHGRANGLDVLIAAAALLRPFPIRILLVGEGSEKPRLMARAMAEGLSNITFLPPIPKPDLARLLAGAQIGLFLLAPVPAFAECTAPNKLMDLCAAGLPIVGNVPGHAARVIEAGPSGLVVPPDDAAALREVAMDRPRREAMGRAAKDMEPFESAYANTDWSKFEKMPLFKSANRMNAYNTYLLMEQEAK